MVESLQRCNWSMKDVLSEVLYTVVCICSRTSRRPKALQDINNMLHIVCMPAEQLGWLNLCRDAIGEGRMYYMRIYIVSIYTQTIRRPKALQDINNMLHLVCNPAEQLEWLNLCRDAIGQ